ncbi:hypothetical protein JYU34_022539, partial [Plutella xylostella]
MKKRDSPNCTLCDKEEDLVHFVLECKINEQPRLDFLHDTQCTAGELLFLVHGILSSSLTHDH